MRLSIARNGSNLIEFNQITISGRKAAGGYAFNFALRGPRRACESAMTILSIYLSVSLNNPARPLLFSVPSSVQLIPCPNYPNNDEQIHFETLLSKDQVCAIEEHRQEGDLVLNFGLRALTTSQDGPWPSLDIADFTIPREHWLKALSAAGYRDTLLFEIPVPINNTEISAVVSKAQEFIETGHYKDAVMQCRHVIELLEQLRDDKSQSAAANTKAHSGDRKEMSSIERLLSLREQLKNICQLGAHGSEAFTRSQARAIFGMTLALLAEPTVGLFEGQLSGK